MSSTNFINNAPLIALIDCNNFFVSCERVFDPKLKKMPVIVLSSNDGCVVSRSNEAKALDIAMGVPYFQIRDFVQKNDGVVRSSNFNLYGDMSARVMRVIAEHTAHMEVYSIDEAFVSVPKTSNHTEWATMLRSRIQKNTGIPVSIGIAKTKTLAKVAAAVGKKNATGVFSMVDNEENAIKLRDFAIEEVWGIGRKFAARVTGAGIHTAGDFVCALPRTVRTLLGVYGERIQFELNGIPCAHTNEEEAARKSITSSHSFGEKTYDIRDIQESIARHALRVSEKLRQDKSAASGIWVYIREGRHAKGMSYRAIGKELFTVPTSDQATLLRAAAASIQKIFKRNLAYRKVGVTAFGIVPEASVPTKTLFSDTAHTERFQLMQAIDAINEKYHQRMVVPLATLSRNGKNARWLPKRENISPEYTTKWKDIMVVR